MFKLAVIDSGICNLFNVMGAFRKLGVEVKVVTKAADVAAAPRVLLPGVGAFGAGMKSLEELDLVHPLQQFARSGKPMMGICLGMQLLMDQSFELGTWKGLGLIAGDAQRLKSDVGPSAVKIPQIGWNTLEKPNGRVWKGSILDHLEESPFAYFVHSFHVQPHNSAVVLAETQYGSNRFCSVLQHQNLWACQFHPERSGAVGLQILRNFVEVVE